jgi:TRAP-type C4-dicarboxylate transport system substrate-binding protein
LAIKEDDILMKKIKEKGIKVVKPQTKNLDEFKKITKVFHESYFNENPHMKKFIL